MVNKGPSPYENTRAALGQLDLSAVSGRSVLIKPNAGRLVTPGKGVTTHPDVVAGVIDAVRDAGAREIAVGESPILGVKALDALEVTGIAEVAAARSCSLVDLDESKPVLRPVPNGQAIKELRVCKLASAVEYLVSVPVLKTHMHTRVSLGLKNLKGVLYRREKVKLHQLARAESMPEGVRPLDVAIADLGLVVRPALTVIDGTVGMEGMGPSAGSPKRMDLVVASSDVLAADATACRLMGLEPQQVPHLRIAAERGLGCIEEERLSVIPADYLKHAESFEPPPEEISLHYPGVEVHESGACSACLSSTLLFLERYLSSIDVDGIEGQKLHLGLGKQSADLPENTLLIGNCAAQEGKGLCVRGCPPVASDIFKHVPPHWIKD